MKETKAKEVSPKIKDIAYYKKNPIRLRFINIMF